MQEKTQTGIDFSRLSFLVVDDNDAMRRLLQGMLRGLGAKEIALHADATAAKAVLDKTLFDIVITDLRMVPGDGLKLLSDLRWSGDPLLQTVPVMMISGHAERDRVASARDAGVNDFLVKPFSPGVLHDRLTGLIRNPRPFIMAPHYRGPCRRRRQDPAWKGPERRGAGKGSAPVGDSFEFIDSPEE